MKLFLASEINNPESIKKLGDFIGRNLQSLKITYIPTAGNGKYYGAWKGGDSIKFVKSLGAKLNVVELEDNHYKDVLTEIRGSDILWMGGGMTGYLLYWIRRIELDKALPEILNSGTIYVGSSAGSMICSETQYLTEVYLGKSEPGASLLPGLGLIDFEIYPHYTEDLLPKIQKKWKKGKLFLLKDGEVIIVEDDKMKFLGEKRFLEK